jgi:hypothetical protein
MKLAKRAVFAPIPRARVRITGTVTAGWRASDRRVSAKCRISSRIQGAFFHPLPDAMAESRPKWAGNSAADAIVI